MQGWGIWEVTNQLAKEELSEVALEGHCEGNSFPEGLAGEQAAGLNPNESALLKRDVMFELVPLLTVKDTGQLPGPYRWYWIKLRVYSGVNFSTPQIAVREYRWLLFYHREICELGSQASASPQV